MKRIILYVFLINILLAGCKPPEEVKYYDLSNDVLYVPFKGLYLRDFQKDKVFFVKGLALDVCEYGRNIEIIEDLKGNFADTSFVFIQDCCRIGDALIKHHKNDTLIMLFEKTYKKDYITLIGHSVLKLSNDYVTGYINNSCGLLEENERETMLWKKLQAELDELLNSTKK